MDNNNLITEINKLKQLIATLQQQIQTQKTELDSVKQIALEANKKATSHWHFVGTDSTNRTFFT
jgi:hypothetical protein